MESPAQAARTGSRLPPAEHRLYPWLATLAVAVMLLRCADTTRHFSHTWDETYHIGSAVALYEARKHVVDLTHPPLAWWAAALPLKLIGVESPALRATTVGKMQRDAWQDGRDILFANNGRDYWRILTTARVSMLIFPVIACFYLYLLARWLANGLVAMLAVLFFCTDPTILGHGAIMKNDVAAAAAYMIGLYHGLRWIVSPSWRHTVAAGLAIGVAVALKFTAMVLLPALLLIGLIRPLSVFTSRIKGGKLRAFFRRLPSIGQIIVSAMIGFVVLWGSYFFQFNSLSKEVFWTETPRVRSMLQPYANIPIPMPGFFQGVINVFAHGQRGHPTYLNGEFQPTGRGWWYYFPEALAIKEPLGVVLALLAATALAIVLTPRRPWRLLAILLPSLLYLFVAMKGGMMLGLRHLTPMLPLIYLFICFELARAKAGRAGLALLLVLMAGSYAETLWRHPNYLAFFNVAVGGPDKGERYMLDGNLDWGQDVYRLGTWLQSPEAPKGVITTRIYGLASTRLLEAMLKGTPSHLADLQAAPSGIFVISKGVKHGFRPERPDKDYESPYQSEDYSWLPKDRLIKRIGNSIEVYDLRGVTTQPASTSPALPRSSSWPGR